MEKKQIVVIINSTAGMYHFRKELLTELCKKWKVTILAKDTGYASELKAIGCNLEEVELDFHGKNPLHELRLIKIYKNHLQALKPFVVLTYTIKPNIYGGIACSKIGIPYIANITGLGLAVENKGLLQKVILPLYRRGLRKARMVFFQNKDNRDFMLSHRMVTGPYDLLPGSGVNLEHFQLLDYPHSDTTDFSFISRIMKQKGIDQYLEAAEAITTHHPDAQFHVFGKCDDTYIERIAEMQKKRIIKYHGYATDVRAVHQKSCCTIHPSYYPEGMSNVLLESAACGRPVITTDRPGCIETVDDGVTGFVVHQQDSLDLIKKIEQFLSLDWEDRRAMGIAAREKVEREFDRKLVVKKYLDLIESLS